MKNEKKPPIDDYIMRTAAEKLSCHFFKMSETCEVIKQNPQDERAMDTLNLLAAAWRAAEQELGEMAKLL